MTDGLRVHIFDVALVRGHTFIASRLGPGSLVLDAGAHRCEFANAMAKRFGCRVIALEPNSTLLREPTEAGVTLVNAALSGADGTATLVLDENPEGSSIIQDHSPRPSGVISVEVPVRSVVSLANEFQIDRIDLLKLDIEGAEISVIDSLDETLSRKISQLTVEFHPSNATGDDEEIILEAVSRLRKLDFYPCKASYNGYGDIFFLNRNIFAAPGKFFAMAMPYYRKGLEYGWI